jgi:RNA polymerase-binding transcription factor DksA
MGPSRSSAFTRSALASFETSVELGSSLPRSTRLIVASAISAYGSQHAERLLTEVEAALARMDAGTYGTSEVSGEPIGYARLSAVPWARFSVVEQEDLERIERR